jgi:hypothetical protein
MVSQSDLLPITTPTSGAADVSLGMSFRNKVPFDRQNDILPQLETTGRSNFIGHD